MRDGNAMTSTVPSSVRPFYTVVICGTQAGERGQQTFSTQLRFSEGLTASCGSSEKMRKVLKADADGSSMGWG